DACIRVHLAAAHSDLGCAAIFRCTHTRRAAFDVDHELAAEPGELGSIPTVPRVDHDSRVQQRSGATVVEKLGRSPGRLLGGRTTDDGLMLPSDFRRPWRLSAANDG